MAERLKLLLGKPANLSSFQGTPESCALTSLQVQWPVCARTHTYNDK